MYLHYEQYSLTNGLQKIKTRTAALLAAAALVFAGGLGLALTSLSPAGAAVTTAVYDSMPDPLASSYPSQPYQAQQTAEFGAKIQFAAGLRNFEDADVVLNSWACETGSWNLGDCVTTPGSTFNQEVTLNIYDVAIDGTKGSLLKTVTQTFAIPYRPTANSACGNNTQWMNNVGGCQNGYNVPVKFNLDSVVLPDQVIYGVAINTQTWGYQPTGVDGPYNSLNFSVVDTTLITSGTSIEVFRAYAPTNIFAAEAGWGTQTPAVQFNVALPKPVSKDDCKKGGWATLYDSNANLFKNQGLCIASVQSNVKSKHNQ